MISVRYKSRALPLCWVVYKGRKGHSPTSTQLALWQADQTLLADAQRIILLGDGAFDGTAVVDWLEQQLGMNENQRGAIAQL